MDRRLRIYNVVVITLFFIVGIWYVSGRQQQTLRSINTAIDREPASLPEISVTAATPAPQPIPQENPRILAARTRLQNLNRALEEATEQQLSATNVDSNIQNISSQIENIENLVMENTIDSDLLINQNQALQRQQEFQNNLLQYDYTREIQLIDNTIASLQSELQQLRFIASTQDQFSQTSPLPPGRDLEVQISNLKSQKTYLTSQIKLNELAANTSNLETAQVFHDALTYLKLERYDLQQQLSDLKAELAYWQEYKSRLGDPDLRTERIETLRRQISQQESELQTLLQQ